MITKKAPLLLLMTYPIRQAIPRSNGTLNGLSSPPSDTQPFTQLSHPPEPRTYAVDDEEGDGVWGYLVPMDDHSGDVLVLRQRDACPVSPEIVSRPSGKAQVAKSEYKDNEEKYEREKQEHGVSAGGYLIGRHRECGM